MNMKEVKGTNAYIHIHYFYIIEAFNWTQKSIECTHIMLSKEITRGGLSKISLI